MLRTKMQWHQERQRLLAENVANADTPQFRPRDLSPPKFDPARPASTQVALARTNTAHLTGSPERHSSGWTAGADSKHDPPETR